MVSGDVDVFGSVVGIQRCLYLCGTLGSALLHASPQRIFIAWTRASTKKHFGNIQKFHESCAVIQNADVQIEHVMLHELLYETDHECLKPKCEVIERHCAAYSSILQVASKNGRPVVLVEGDVRFEPQFHNVVSRVLGERHSTAFALLLYRIGTVSAASNRRRTLKEFADFDFSEITAGTQAYAFSVDFMIEFLDWLQSSRVEGSGVYGADIELMSFCNRVVLGQRVCAKVKHSLVQHVGRASEIFNWSNGTNPKYHRAQDIVEEQPNISERKVVLQGI